MKLKGEEREEKGEETGRERKRKMESIATTLLPQKRTPWISHWKHQITVITVKRLLQCRSNYRLLLLLLV